MLKRSVRGTQGFHFFQYTLLLESRKIENTIAYRNPNSGCTVTIAVPKHAERQILNWKIRGWIVCRLNPAMHAGIVGLVDYGLHEW